MEELDSPRTVPRCRHLLSNPADLDDEFRCELDHLHPGPHETGSFWTARDPFKQPRSVEATITWE